MAKIKTIKFDVIFDNGGGISLQTNRYYHYYQDPAQAADDVKLLLSGECVNPAGEWEGNAPDERQEYDYEQERNGGCEWQSKKVIRENIKKYKADKTLLEEISGFSETEFYEALIS